MRTLLRRIAIVFAALLSACSRVEPSRPPTTTALPTLAAMATRTVVSSLATTPSPTLSQTSTPSPPPTASSTPRSAETPGIPHIAFFQVTPTEVEAGDPVTLTWQASGDRATICPSARFVLFTSDDCWPVPLSGTTTFTIPQQTGGNRFVSFLLSVEAQGAADPAVWETAVAFRCHTAWFFSDQPQAGICPREPTTSRAAAQRFERGMMIWVQGLGRYYILGEDPLFEQDVRKRLDVISEPLDIVRDTSTDVVPPAGLLAPASDFGLVWRGDVVDSPGYREVLGWALMPELEYEIVFQCDDALPSGGRSWQTCFLRGPDDRVVVLHPLGGWYVRGEREGD